jgi:hypothetical protein
MQLREAIQALAAQPAPVQPVPWSQALESVWAEPDDTPSTQPAVQEPVAVLNHAHGVYAFRSVNLQGLPDGEYQVYTAPLAAAVPDAIHHTDLSEHPQYIEGWNDCRAEMLKGMK